ncbi:MAG TPA: hypothetical protein VMY37_38500 [Thermoguttaceae bacterium]|nr:hypothetical protein [Thermoguttaceae bacterium]
MVALRWDGAWLSGQQLMAKASAAVGKLDAQFSHLDHLDVKALPADEPGQYVQLIVEADCTDSEATKIRDVLKREFATA